jgi:RNA polymerase I-specific transcription initiation factor RRN3
VALLTPELEHFVSGVLIVNFASEDPAVAASFRNFLCNLITAHVFYIKPIVQRLVKNFISGKQAKSNSSEEPSTPPESIQSQDQAFDFIHETIKSLIKVAPLAVKERLIRCCSQCLPYALGTDHTRHTNYIRNLSVVVSYLENSQDRVAILKIIIGRLIELDAHLPKLLLDELEEDSEEDEVFEMEDSFKTPEVSLVARENLDHAMSVMFEFIKNHKDLNQFYKEFLLVFESHILPSYKTGHVQFLLFYMLAVDKPQRLLKSFLNFLFSKFRDPNTSAIMRQSCVVYIASLVTRAKFVDLNTIKMILTIIVDWVHAYADARGDASSANWRTHAPFYAACQSAMYIFAFLHKDFEKAQEMPFVNGLNFSKIITGSLNPLRFCLPTIANQFAAISNHYQIAYCRSIMQRNTRMNLPTIGNLYNVMEEPILLDDFFPFDPYKLKASESFVSEFYREYSGILFSHDEHTPEMIHTDFGGHVDHISDDVSLDIASPVPSKRQRKDSLTSFSYGTSPGFKHQ